MVRLPDLPTDIVRDILSRLPVKSLLRFKCVSKPWCQLIERQDFISDHLKQSLSTSSNRSLILCCEAQHLKTVDFDTLDCVHELNPPFKYYNITNSINGLFLIVTNDKSPLIWNPSTRKHKKLPVDTSTDFEKPPGYIAGSKFETYGFGYDAKNDDYKVFKIVKYKTYHLNWVNVETRVYSLKLNIWRNTKPFPYPLGSSGVWGVYVNGALHDHILSPEHELTIMAFHVGDEKHMEVPTPNLLGQVSEMSLLTEIRGCLGLVNPGMFDIDVWVMKQYGVQESWFKLFSVKINGINMLFPLGYSKSGDTVLVTDSNINKLYWYDLKKKCSRDVQIRNLPSTFFAMTCIGSLVRVDGHLGLDVLKKQDKAITKNPGKKRDDFLSKGFKLVL